MSRRRRAHARQAQSLPPRPRAVPERCDPASPPATSRRQFLANAAGVAAGTSLWSCFPDARGRWPTESAAPRAVCHADSALPAVAGASVVAEVHDGASVDTSDGRNQVQLVTVEAMLEDALKALTSDAAAPWRVVLPDYQAGMRIGLKVNCLNGYCPTSVSLVKAVCTSLRQELGVDAEHIIVWDRRLDELTDCGYDANDLGVPVMGTVSSPGDGSGPGYEDAVCTINGKTTRLSRILTELTDVTLNCPVLKTHGVSGVTAGMKNVYGVIDNPGDFHRDLPTALPSIYALEPIRQRIRLTVLDALVAVTQGGTSSPADEVPCRMLLGMDPVATDSRALALVNQLRAARAGEPDAIAPELTAWLDNAHALGLGAGEHEIVEVVR